MPNRFTESARRALACSLELSAGLGHSHIGSEHLLYSIADSDKSEAGKVLIDCGINAELIKNEIVILCGMGKPSELTLSDLTPMSKRLLMAAAEKCGSADFDNKNNDGTVYIRSEHILMAILREDCLGKHIIKRLGGDPETIVASLERKFSDDPVMPPEFLENNRERRIPTPVLDRNSYDLTEKARSGKTDTLIGRDKEIDEIISILMRKNKNNPVLVGKAGVGKTAIAEGLAKRVCDHAVPEFLWDKRIMCLSVATVVAGTKYRGEFEEKMQKIVEECKADRNVILFIDEIHTLCGAGGAEGAVDASNILKPALSRGDIRVIGATTRDEYNKFIRRDKALERRFRALDVGEPSAVETLEILHGIKKDYERHHKLLITGGAMNAAVELSDRYVSGRSFPDKAIDLLDEAASRKRMRGGKTLTEADINELLLSLSLVPADMPTRAARVREKLDLRFFGQDKAKLEICEEFDHLYMPPSCNNNNFAAYDRGKPFCSFYFTGKAGSGKRHCAKLLAEALFGEARSLRCFDMSSYSESYSVSRLIGSPSGYAGHDEGGLLTGAVEENPFSVLYFDNFQAACPDVQSLLLGILQNAVLTDGRGQETRFDNCVLIFADSFINKNAIGFDSAASAGYQAGGANIGEFVHRSVHFEPTAAETLLKIGDFELSSGFPHLSKAAREKICAEATSQAKNSADMLKRIRRAVMAYNADENNLPDEKLLLTNNKK